MAQKNYMVNRVSVGTVIKMYWKRKDLVNQQCKQTNVAVY